MYHIQMAALCNGASFSANPQVTLFSNYAPGVDVWTVENCACKRERSIVSSWDEKLVGCVRERVLYLYKRHLEITLPVIQLYHAFG
jgi:hypothetical protein